MLAADTRLIRQPSLAVIIELEYGLPQCPAGIKQAVVTLKYPGSHNSLVCYDVILADAPSQVAKMCRTVSVFKEEALDVRRKGQTQNRCEVSLHRVSRWKAGLEIEQTCLQGACAFAYACACHLQRMPFN